MLNQSTKAVSHFDKYVPCCEGRAIAHSDDRARLVRVATREEAEKIAESVIAELHESNTLQGEYRLGDNYMLSQHPVTSP